MVGWPTNISVSDRVVARAVSSELRTAQEAISRIGIGSTLGLIGLVSLPRGFVFRPSQDDPHPMPWVRVLLSCAIGDRLYPDPQWERLAATWQAMYPIAGVRPQLSAIISELRATLPDLVSVVVEHRPALLRGRSLGEVLRNPELRREALLEQFQNGAGRPGLVPAVQGLVGYDILDQLSEVDVPTLIVWGRNDRVVPPQDAVAYGERLRNSRTVIFNDTGHLPQLERPVRFNRLLETFLAE